MCYRLCIAVIVVYCSINCEAQLPSFWNMKAKKELDRAMNIPSRDYRAKNVIFFIGDGMSMTTITTTRIYKEELNGGHRNQKLLSFEEFEHVGLVKTYTTDRLVADSSGSATAFCTGVKTRSRVVGVDDRVLKDNCSSFKPEYGHKSFLRLAAEQGKSVGLVTTTRITHGTPAATYANSANRKWECDTEVPAGDLARCPDIARQMLDNAIDFRVILGGGRRTFMLKNQSDPYDRSKKGKRLDQDLIKLWKQRQASKNRRFRYVTNGYQLRHVDTDKVDYLLGLFSHSHMEFDFHRKDDQPSLEEMVITALKVLRQNDKGYVLFVEGGRIDHAHHKTLAKLALYETLAYNKAVESSVKLANLDDTLIMSTSDHSHVFTFGSYHIKGLPILAKSKLDMGYGIGLAADRKPFTSILYANGPSGPVNQVRKDITDVNTTLADYRFQSAVPLWKETHAGEDVPVYASGPMAHLIHGVHEQNYLAHVVMYAACLGNYANEKGCPVSFSYRLLPSSYMSLIFSVVVMIWILRLKL